MRSTSRFKPEEQGDLPADLPAAGAAGRRGRGHQAAGTVSRALARRPGRAAAMREVIRVLADRDARLITTEGAVVDRRRRRGRARGVDPGLEAAPPVDRNRACGLAHPAPARPRPPKEWAAARPSTRTIISTPARAWQRAASGPRRIATSSARSRQTSSPPARRPKGSASKMNGERASPAGSAEAAGGGAERAEDAEAAAAAEAARLRFLVAAVVAGVLAVTSGGRRCGQTRPDEQGARREQRTRPKRTAQAQTSRQAAMAQARIAESRRLAVLSDAVRPERLDLAMLLALEAARQRDTLEARGSLQRCSRRASGSRSLPPRPRGRCHERGLRAGGQIAAGFGAARGGVVLFDARGERLRPTPLEVKEGDVTSVAFGPEGQIAAGFGVASAARRRRRGALRRPGQRLRPAPLEVKEGDVTSVAFGPQGQIAAGYGASAACSGVVLFDARGERLDPRRWRSRRAMSRAWPSGRRARSPRDMSAAAASGGVVLFDARGERLRPTPLEVKEGDVMSVAFGPEGQIAAGYVGGAQRRGALRRPGRAAPTHAAGGEGGPCMSVASGRRARSPRICGGGVGGGVVLFDARGERLRPAPLKVKEGDVRSVAFGPEGQIAAGYGGGGSGGGVVLFDADLASWLRKAGQVAHTATSRGTSGSVTVLPF